MSHLCECGCGQPTKLARQSTTSRGHVAGQPMKFLPGHNSRKGKTPEERFWSKVNKETTLHPLLHTPCWLWTGYRMPFGHGQIRINHKAILVHRFSWELHHGPILERMYVCHHCDVPNCVNPEHLFLGTQKDNMQDALQKNRMVMPWLFGEV